MIPYIHTNPYRPPQWADQPRSKFPRRREMLRGKGVRQSTSKVQLWWEFPWFNMIQDYSSRKWWKLMDGQETCRRSLETRLVCHSATLPTHPEVMTWTRATAMWQGLASFLNMLSALESQLRLIEVNYISLHHHLVHWNLFFYIWSWRKKTYSQPRAVISVGFHSLGNRTRKKTQSMQLLCCSPMVHVSKQP